MTNTHAGAVTKTLIFIGTVTAAARTGNIILGSIRQNIQLLLNTFKIHSPMYIFQKYGYIPNYGNIPNKTLDIIHI